MVEQTLVELAVDVLEKHAELEKTCGHLRSRQGSWTLYSVPGCEAKMIAIDGLRNAWTMLDRLNRLAQASLNIAPGAPTIPMPAHQARGEARAQAGQGDALRRRYGAFQRC